MTNLLAVPANAVWEGVRRRLQRWPFFGSPFVVACRLQRLKRRLQRRSTLSHLDPPRTALIAAARQGDAERVERLMRDGADPDLAGSRGWTALHEAVAGGHVEAAACLLAWGASHTITNDAGLRPLSLDFVDAETLHAVRLRYHRSAHVVPHPQARSDTASNWAAELEEKGIIKVAGLIEPDVLARMQDEFAGFVRSLEGKIAQGNGVFRHYDEEEHWWRKDKAYVCNNAFKYSKELVKFCCEQSLVECANLYVGKPACITRGLAVRYFPMRSKDHDMFGWHHDMEEKRFKIMILLSDVGANDQNMSYVMGSHKLFHPYKMFFKNRCSLAYCRKYLPKIDIYDATGRAGDVFFFDSNGAHRGNRREGASTRDVFLVEFSGDKSDVWGGDVDSGIIRDIPLGEGNPFSQMMAVEKKWNRPFSRNAPTWIENLPDVESWL